MRASALENLTPEKDAGTVEQPPASLLRPPASELAKRIADALEQIALLVAALPRLRVTIDVYYPNGLIDDLKLIVRTLEGKPPHD